MVKTKKLLKYLRYNKVSIEEALDILETLKKGKRPREKAVIKEYETRI